MDTNIDELLEGLDGDLSLKKQYINFLINDSNYSDRTCKQTLTIFRTIACSENLFKRDFIYMTYDETVMTLKSMITPSLSVLTSNVTLLRNYCAWALSEKLIVQNTHPIMNISRKHLKEMTNKIGKLDMYITKNTLDEIIANCKNYQDKAYILLNWLGLYSKADKTILTIKNDYIDYENLTLHYNIYHEEKFINEFGLEEIREFIEPSEIKLTIDEMFILEMAMREADYITGVNAIGEIKEKTLNDTDYLLRSCYSPRYKNMTPPNEPLSITVAKIRFNNIKKELGLNYLRTYSLYTSGIVYRMLNKKNSWTLNEIRRKAAEVNMTCENLKEAYDILVEKYKLEKNN